ncbi:Uncharacterised protein [Mycobacterium tuberculosis]|nr:Uncharacterised protein [Mycobacterium tuberculosis]
MLQADAGQITGHELGRAALLSVRTHRGHHRDRGAGHDGRPGIEHAATFDQVDTRRGFDLFGHRQRLTGERGLVDLHVDLLNHPGVGGNHLVGPHLDDVAGTQLLGADFDVPRLVVRAGQHLPGGWNLLSQQAIQPTFGTQPLAGRENRVSGEHRTDHHRVHRRTQHRTGHCTKRQHRRQRVRQLRAHGLGQLPKRVQGCLGYLCAALRRVQATGQRTGRIRRRRCLRRCLLVRRRQSFADLLDRHCVPFMSGCRSRCLRVDDLACQQVSREQSGRRAGGHRAGPQSADPWQHQQGSQSRCTTGNFVTSLACGPGRRNRVQHPPGGSKIGQQDICVPGRCTGSRWWQHTKRHIGNRKRLLTNR